MKYIRTYISNSIIKKKKKKKKKIDNEIWKVSPNI